MRAIDEIEDHPDLDPADKQSLLHSVSEILGKAEDETHLASLAELFAPFEDRLPKVTRSLRDHALLAPEAVARAVWKSTAEMAHRMAFWVRTEWHVATEQDLDDYTFDVAGRVGVLLNELWDWHDGSGADRELAIGFGRGLQAVNIIRNREEDRERGGVDFYPDSWSQERMFEYANRQLAMGDRYVETLAPGPARDFCTIPLNLAHATLAAIEAGHEKLTRSKVLEVIEQCTGEQQCAAE